jgi:hypothetical protein
MANNAATQSRLLHHAGRGKRLVGKKTAAVSSPHAALLVGWGACVFSLLQLLHHQLGQGGDGQVQVLLHVVCTAQQGGRDGSGG